MGCGFFIDWLVCGPIKLPIWILSWILPGEGIVTDIIALIIILLFVYISVKSFGAAGGVLLIVLGIAGAAFTAGATIALTIVGFIAVMTGKKAGLITGIVAIMGIICIVCSMI